MKHQKKRGEIRATFFIIKLLALPDYKTKLKNRKIEQFRTQGHFPVDQFYRKRAWSCTTMTSSRSALQILALVFFASLGLTEQYIQSEITGYGILSA